jgi:hypothetical protein
LLAVLVVVVAEARAHPGYHDPTAGWSGAPPARSALTLRIVLASYGLVVCGLASCAGNPAEPRSRSTLTAALNDSSPATLAPKQAPCGPQRDQGGELLVGTLCRALARNVSRS